MDETPDPRLPDGGRTVLRLDGVHFSRFTRGLTKPFDMGFVQAMKATCLDLCTDSGAPVDFAYVGSDEITLVLREQVDAWYSNRMEKMSSVLAGMASARFNHHFSHPAGKLGWFDARAFWFETREQAVENVAERIRATRRNAISMKADAVLGKKAIHGVPTRERIAMIGTEQFESIPPDVLYGSIASSRVVAETVSYTHSRTGQTHTVEALRTRWDFASARDFNG